MGVLANTKQFLANKITNVAQKTADGIASSSALSPKQMLDIEKKRMENGKSLRKKLKVDLQKD